MFAIESIILTFQLKLQYRTWIRKELQTAEYRNKKYFVSPRMLHVKPINLVHHSSVCEEQFNLTPKQGHNNDPLLWSEVVQWKCLL